MSRIETAEIPADLKQRIKEMMARRVGREDKTINELLLILRQAAKWIEDHCQGDTAQMKAIQKRLRIEFGQFLSIRSAQDVTDEQRAKLLDFAGGDGVLDLCDILAEIGESKEGSAK